METPSLALPVSPHTTKRLSAPLKLFVIYARLIPVTIKTELQTVRASAHPAQTLLLIVLLAQLLALA
jgi:hypothetical protein